MIVRGRSIQMISAAATALLMTSFIVASATASSALRSSLSDAHATLKESVVAIKALHDQRSDVPAEQRRALVNAERALAGLGRALADGDADRARIASASASTHLSALWAWNRAEQGEDFFPARPPAGYEERVRQHVQGLIAECAARGVACSAGPAERALGQVSLSTSSSEQGVRLQAKLIAEVRSIEETLRRAASEGAP